MRGRWEGTLLTKDKKRYLARFEDDRLSAFVDRFDNEFGGFSYSFKFVDQGQGKCRVECLFKDVVGLYKQDGEKVKICVNFNGIYPKSLDDKCRYTLILRRCKTKDR